MPEYVPMCRVSQYVLVTHSCLKLILRVHIADAYVGMSVADVSYLIEHINGDLIRRDIGRRSVEGPTSLRQRSQPTM